MSKKVTYIVTLGNGMKLTVLAFVHGTKAEASERVLNFYPKAKINHIHRK